MSDPVGGRIADYPRKSSLFSNSPPQVLIGTSLDLERKRSEFKDYYNCYRAYSASSDTPAEIAGKVQNPKVDLADYRWETHCAGLLHTPSAA